MVSRQLVRWENDQARPRPKALEHLAEVLEVPLEELISEESESSVENIDDPELQDLLGQIHELSTGKLEALKTVLRDMITCEQITRVTTRAQHRPAAIAS